MRVPIRLLLPLLAAVFTVLADDGPAPATKPAEPPAAAPIETDHQLTIGGSEVSYTARAGTLALKTEEGKDRASIFYIAYTRSGNLPPEKRPVTFCFNGGPGSSSVWLHMGAFGPRKVRMRDDGSALPPPATIEDNANSILDFTDLVFIDPVSTGYSRPAPGTDAKAFHGYDEDLDSVAQFIRSYVTNFERWASPKFLAGESYGTIRAAGLANRLQNQYGMYLNGVVLVSTVLNFQTIAPDEGNDLPHIAYLPTYAATAWYHKRLPPDLQALPLPELAERARHFAENEYAQALMAGTRLPKDRYDAVVNQVARLTGLPAALVDANDLRVDISRFAKELLRADRRTVGRFDGRYLGMDHDWGSDNFAYDPSFAVIHGPIATALNDYLRRELAYKSDLPYEILTGRVQPWNYGPFKNRYLNVSKELRDAMTVNPDLHLFVASGYYDLATPFAGADYTMAHLGLPGDLQSHVTTAYYEAGHMMYLHLPSLAKLRQDLKAFYGQAIP